MGENCREVWPHYDLVTVVSFFCGILLTIVLDLITKFLMKLDCMCKVFILCR